MESQLNLELGISAQKIHMLTSSMLKEKKKILEACKYFACAPWIAVYVDPYEEIYSDLKPDSYVCETASNAKEAMKLIEQGFEFVCTIEGE